MINMPHWPMPSWNKKLEFGNEKILKFLELLDNPHLKIPKVIHVGGTNGKGSTIAFLRSILEKAGLKAHVYTSPHLVDYTERIILASKKITKDFLSELLEECRIIAEKYDIQLSFFEGITAAAFLAFSRVSADVTIIEVGMGGRLDATNVFNQVAISIITPISLDHIEYLGEDIASIALEKAGIIKANCPCILSLQTKEAFEVISRVCESLNSPLYAFEYDFGAYIADYGFQFLSETLKIQLPMPNLSGDHQIINASTAIAALNFLPEVEINQSHIISGIRSAVWPARLQQVIQGKYYKMLPSGSEIWVDGAHNEAGALTLYNWSSKFSDLPLYLIFGMTRGRNITAFLGYFKNVKHVCCMLIEAEPYSYTSEKIVEQLKDTDISCSPASSFEDALEDIIKMSNGKCRIIVTGSLYIAGDFLDKNNEFNYI